MIFNMTLYQFSDIRVVRNPTYKTDRWGDLIRPYQLSDHGARMVGNFAALREHLSTSEDIFLWTYSKNQKEVFDDMLKKANVKEFIVFHSPMVTNPNYNERRVAVCIMKGKKQNAETQADAGL